MKQRSDSFSQDFLSQRHALMGFILGLARDPHLAEDVFQEVWLRLAKAAHQGKEISNLPGWCRITARHILLHHWRDQRKRTIQIDSDFLDLVELAFDEQEDESYWEERRIALQGCLDDLPMHARKALHLRYMEVLPMKELAKNIGKSLNATLMTISRLRRALTDCAEKRLAPQDTQS